MKEKNIQGTRSQKRKRRVFSFAEGMRTAVTGAALGGFAAWICYRSLYAVPVAAFLAFLYMRAAVKRRREYRIKLMNYHFRDFLSSLHTAMKAGYSLENGVRAAASDTERLHGKKDPLSAALRDICGQMAYSRPVENLFWELGLASGVEDIRNFGEALMIAKRTGGGLSRVMEAAWRNVSERIDAEQEIDALISSKQAEQRFLSLMPVAILFYMRLAFPDLLEKLYGNPAGVITMTVCLAVYLAALLLARRMARIEV